MSQIREKASAIEVELLASDERENYQGLTVKCIMVYLSILLACAGQVIAVVATGGLARNVAASVGGEEKYIWIPQGLVICTTFTAAPIAQCSDFWGRRVPILICTALCFTGSIVIGRAVSMDMAIAGAILVGLGSGSISLLYAVASEIMPRRHRPLAQAGVHIANSLGGLITLLAGFALVKKSDEGFRVIWYIGAGFFAINFVAILFFFTPPPRPLQVSLTLRQKLRALDWVGYIMFSVGIILFSMGLTWANNPYPWKDAHVLGTFVPGVVILGLAITWEVKKKDGFCHHGLFQNGNNFIFSLVIIFVEGFTYYAINNFLPLEYLLLFGTDQFKAGVLMSIIFIAGMISAPIAGFYSSKTKRVRPPLVAGMAFFVIYFACMATIKMNQSAAIWGFTVLAGFGLGFGFVIGVTMGQISTPPGLIATTSGLILTARSLGGSVALPAYTAILNSSLSKNLAREIASRILPLGFLPENLPGFIGALAGNDRQALASIPGVNPDVVAAGLVGLRTAYHTAFRGIWVLAAAISAVACILAFLVIDPRRSFNMHVDAPVEYEISPKLHDAGPEPTGTQEHNVDKINEGAAGKV